MGNCFHGLTGPAARAPKNGFKVCICGAAGQNGQPLALMMALDPNVTELALYDLSIAATHPEGVAVDLRHIERNLKVTSYCLEPSQKPVDHLAECFTGCDLVLVPVGVPSKGRARIDLLTVNANITRTIVEACAKFCPKAIVGLIVNPMTSVVPAMSKLYESRGLDPKRIIGVAALDHARANKFVHEATGCPVEQVNVPVVGGFSGMMKSETAVPLLSQDPTARGLSDEQRDQLKSRLHTASEDVMSAKNGKGQATLSAAYATGRWAQAVLRGLAGERMSDTCFIKTDGSVYKDFEFFTTSVTFGPNGVEQVHPIGPMSELEKHHLDAAAKTLRQEIHEGVSYATKNPKEAPMPPNYRKDGSNGHDGNAAVRSLSRSLSPRPRDPSRRGA